MFEIGRESFAAGELTLPYCVGGDLGDTRSCGGKLFGDLCTLLTIVTAVTGPIYMFWPPYGVVHNGTCMG